MVEEVQEETANWFDEPVHRHWISTRDFASTGESFYCFTGSTPDASESDDDLTPTGEAKAWRETLPPSLRWLADSQNLKIPTTRVSTDEEKELFKVVNLVSI